VGVPGSADRDSTFGLFLFYFTGKWIAVKTGIKLAEQSGFPADRGRINACSDEVQRVSEGGGHLNHA